MKFKENHHEKGATKMRAREYTGACCQEGGGGGGKSCESACPASRKYGRTKIPHVRREIDEKEREREGIT